MGDCTCPHCGLGLAELMTECQHEWRYSEGTMMGYVCWKCNQWMPPLPNNTITVNA